MRVRPRGNATLWREGTLLSCWLLVGTQVVVVAIVVLWVFSAHNTADPLLDTACPDTRRRGNAKSLSGCSDRQSRSLLRDWCSQGGAIRGPAEILCIVSVSWCYKSGVYFMEQPELAERGEAWRSDPMHMGGLQTCERLYIKFIMWS